MAGRVRVPVVGGPAGRPRRVFNPQTKRGWSIVKAHWMCYEPLDQAIVCAGTCYRLVYENGKPYYVGDPEPAILTEARKVLSPMPSVSGPCPSGP